jgi:hypothetical protein
MVAKVIPPKGVVFYVKDGSDIHDVCHYDTLPQEDKNYLAFALIIGRENGFTVRRDNRVDAHIIDCCQPVLLPMGTRIEPLQQKPSLREK